MRASKEAGLSRDFKSEWAEEVQFHQVLYGSLKGCEKSMGILTGGL
jgi:hypothetical protein